MSSVAKPPPKESSAAFSTAVRAEVDAAAVPFVEEEGSIVAKVIVWLSVRKGLRFFRINFWC